LSDAEREPATSERDCLESLARALAHDVLAPLRAGAEIARWIESEARERQDGRLDVADLRSGPPGSIADDAPLLVRRLEQTILTLDALIRYARLDGMMAEAPRPIDLHELLAVVVADTLPERLVVVSQVDCDSVSAARPTALRALLTELLRNVAEHAGDSCTSVNISIRAHERAIEGSVEDDGVGVPEAFAAVAFEPCRTLATSGRRGVGMGLAFARRIVALHGGRICLEPGVPSGVRVRFRLPEARQ
jgi:signal transduction histidine kinase